MSIRVHPWFHLLATAHPEAATGPLHQPERRGRIDAQHPHLGRKERQLLQRAPQTRLLGVAVHVAQELRGDEMAGEHVALQLGHVDAVGGEPAERLVQRRRHVPHAEHERRHQVRLRRIGRRGCRAMT